MSRETSDSASAVCALFRKRINVLLVDDDPTFLEVLGTAFGSPVLNIVAAKSFSEAEALIRDDTREWHCWIVDVILDGHSGFGARGPEAEFPLPLFHNRRAITFHWG